MDKKIEFRGLDEEGVWCYGYFIMNGRQAIIQNNDYCYWEVKRKTIGQFTGLKDKKGKKIFEGDIIKNQYGETNKVVFWEGCFCEMWNEIGKKKGHIFEPKNVEVIGNIYENPELMEIKK